MLWLDGFILSSNAFLKHWVLLRPWWMITELDICAHEEIPMRGQTGALRFTGDPYGMCTGHSMSIVRGSWAEKKNGFGNDILVACKYIRCGNISFFKVVEVRPPYLMSPRIGAWRTVAQCIRNWCFRPVIGHSFSDFPCGNRRFRFSKFSSVDTGSTALYNVIASFPSRILSTLPFLGTSVEWVGITKAWYTFSIFLSLNNSENAAAARRCLAITTKPDVPLSIRWTSRGSSGHIEKWVSGPSVSRNRFWNSGK